MEPHTPATKPAATGRGEDIHEEINTVGKSGSNPLYSKLLITRLFFSKIFMKDTP